MRLGSSVQEAVRYKISPSLKAESMPLSGKFELKGAAAFSTASATRGNSITLFRNVSIARVFFSVAEYPALRDLYDKLEVRDQEVLVLTKVSSTPATGGN